MLPYIILGILAGSAYALASLGMVLTYKTTGIFNFAYGGIALFFAFVFHQFRDTWGLSQWLSIPLLLLIVAPIVGLVLEVLFRPLTTASAEVQIVVALGVLSVFLTLVPLIFDTSGSQLPTIFPHGGTTWLDTSIPWDRLGDLITALVVAAGLYVLLRRTRLGTATRAVVDNRDLAGLNGINAGTIGRVAWILSMVFAALAGVLLSTENGLLPQFLPFLVIYSFAAAVLGRLTSFPLAFLGSIVLGVAQNLLAHYGSSGVLANAESSIPYFALLVLLVVYGGQLKEVRSTVRPLVGRGRLGTGRTGWMVGLAALVFAATVLPQAFAASTVHDMAEAMAASVVALTVVALTGWTGQISIAQMSFAGIGAFTAAHIAGTHGSLFPVAVLVGILIALPAGLIVGLPSLRLSGLFLALATLAFALLMDNFVFSFSSITGGLTGLSLTSAKFGPFSLRSATSQFYLCLTVLAIVATAAYWLRRGPVGRRLQMVRDSPNAAVTLGASLTYAKLAVFAVGAAVASVGGSLLAMTQQVVTPGNFRFDQSLQLLLVVVLCGRSLVFGGLFASGFYLVQLLPLSSRVHTYLPLAVALGVIGLSKEPDGVLFTTVRSAKYCLATLYRRPRPQALTSTEPFLPSDLEPGHPNGANAPASTLASAGHGLARRRRSG